MRREKPYILWPNGDTVASVRFLAKRWRKHRYHCNYLGFWYIYLPLAIAEEIIHPNVPVIEFSLLLFVAYFFLFSIVVKLPWFFYSDGFIEPNTFVKHFLKRNDIFISYDTIKSIDFEGVSEYGYDYFLSGKIGWNRNLNESIYKSNLYRDSRIRQKVNILTSEGDRYTLSLNLYEEIHQILLKYFRENWQNNWYKPRNEDKIYFPIKGLDKDYI